MSKRFQQTGKKKIMHILALTALRSFILCFVKCLSSSRKQIVFSIYLMVWNFFELFANWVFFCLHNDLISAQHQIALHNMLYVCLKKNQESEKGAFLPFKKLSIKRLTKWLIIEECHTQIYTKRYAHWRSNLSKNYKKVFGMDSFIAPIYSVTWKLVQTQEAGVWS